MAKQYGLIIPGKDKTDNPAPTNLLQKNVFGSDSEDDENSSRPKASNYATSLKRQVRLAQQKALEEDPTVYQYDEIYEEMGAKKEADKKIIQKQERKPRYINKLLETASKRKQEQERRVERQVQKEREAEGSEFADKECFVTTSYRKKLEELKMLEEQEKREDYLESIGDVTKQQDLGGFYRHLYSQKLGDEKKVPENVQVTPDNDPDEAKKLDSTQKSNRKRHYRKRSQEREDNADEEMCTENKQHLQSNLDADSDFSIDSSDSESEHEGKDQPPSEATEVENKNDIEIKKEKEEPSQAMQWNDGFKIPEKIKSEEKIIPAAEIKKPKINIWQKRTVGDILEDALRRYYERKSSRQIIF